MNLVVRIPDEHADRVSAADPARLEQTALQAVLQFAGEPGTGGAGSHEGRGAVQAAAAWFRANRVPLPAGMTIRDLMTHGRD